MTTRATAAVLAACTLLGACAAAPEAPPAVPESPAPPVEARRTPSEAENLLSYFAQIRRLNAPELAREHDLARQAYGGARSDYNRVRLAMVVSMPNTPFNDESRALDLLDPLTKSSASQLSGLALLLVSQIQERRSAHALQQKLDALKSLERSLLERKR